MRRNKGGGCFKETLGGPGDCLGLRNGRPGRELPVSLGKGAKE